MRLLTSCALKICSQSAIATCTPSRMAFGPSPSRARTSAKKDSMRASVMGVTSRPNHKYMPARSDEVARITKSESGRFAALPFSRDHKSNRHLFGTARWTRQRMLHARLLFDPFAQGHTLSEPCTRAPFRSVVAYRVRNGYCASLRDAKQGEVIETGCINDGFKVGTSASASR